MQVKAIKFGALLLANAAALALSNALPVQSFPQWVTIKGSEGSDLIYDFNSLKAWPKGIKQVDTYFPNIRQGDVMYISCPRWRRKSAGDLKWGIIPPNSLIEGLAYKLCGGRLPNARSRSLSYPPCSDNSLGCALKSF